MCISAHEIKTNIGAKLTSICTFIQKQKPITKTVSLQIQSPLNKFNFNLLRAAPTSSLIHPYYYTLHPLSQTPNLGLGFWFLRFTTMEAAVIDAGSSLLKAGFAIPDQTPAMVTIPLFNSQFSFLEFSNACL